MRFSEQAMRSSPLSRFFSALLHEAGGGEGAETQQPHHPRFSYERFFTPILPGQDKLGTNVKIETVA
jgi:hypothetical protein